MDKTTGTSIEKINFIIAYSIMKGINEETFWRRFYGKIKRKDLNDYYILKGLHLRFMIYLLESCLIDTKMLRNESAETGKYTQFSRRFLTSLAIQCKNG